MKKKTQGANQSILDLLEPSHHVLSDIQRHKLKYCHHRSRAKPKTDAGEIMWKTINSRVHQRGKR